METFLFIWSYYSMLLAFIFTLWAGFTLVTMMGKPYYGLFGKHEIPCVTPSSPPPSPSMPGRDSPSHRPGRSKFEL